MPYTHYSLDDFLLDESFQAYTAGKEAAAVAHWQDWLVQHPEKQNLANQAHDVLQDLAAARVRLVPTGLKEQELQRFRQGRRERPVLAPRLRSQRRAGRVALVLASLLLLVGLGWWQWPTASLAGSVLYATGNGEQRTLTLPDGSVVTLNSNSALRTAAHWTAETPREVWLTGEGYFQVAHLAGPATTNIVQAPANVKFVVHAGQLNVSVLGTQFDVNSRAGSTKVVLNSGKVAVERPTLLMRENLLMQPGDLVETSAARPGLSRRQVPAALYSGWTQGRLKLAHTSMRDVVQLLRDSYGLQVEVSDPALLRQTLVGEVPTTTPDVLLKALAVSLESKVTRTGNQVRFSSARR